MLASKIICDDAYSNKLWCIVGQGTFAFQEINQMEWEMCLYLEWQLSVDPSTLRDFQAHVQHDFAGPGLYRIRRWSSLSQLPHHLPTKALLISAQVALLCLLSLPMSPWISNYPQSDNKNIPFLTPDTPEASRPRPHPHHRFRHKHYPMHMALHFARLYQQIQSSSSLTATDQDLF